MLTTLFAVLAAACNAMASVLQRYAARRVPDAESLRPALIADLVRRPVWWAGIGAAVTAGLFQAAALLVGRLAVVQPILATELPFTLLIAAMVFHQSFGRRALVGSVILTAGVALLLLSVAPFGGRSEVSGLIWLIAILPTLGGIALLVLVGSASQGTRRAAFFGGATAVGFALTAALLKDATGRLDDGFVPFLTAWQTYGAGIAAGGTMFLLQSAYQAGTLAASQPVITVGDALVSLAYSATIFQERLRLGIWLIPEIVAVALLLIGSYELSHSPLVSGRPHGTDSARCATDPDREPPPSGSYKAPDL